MVKSYTTRLLVPVFVLFIVFSVISSYSVENRIDGLSFGDAQNPIRSVIAGYKAQRYQFPYQISLQLGKENNYKHICSGAILSQTWVVTTAYCVTPSGNFRVIAGLLVQNQSEPDVQIVEVEKVVPYIDYKGGISENDIALLKLKSPLIFNRAIHQIYPAPANLEDDNIWGAALLSEWNVQTQLHKQFSFSGLYYMIVYIMKQIDCADALGNSIISSDKVICTEKTNEALFCPGESGAPLAYDGYLVGLTSWGLLPCDVTVYTKISYFTYFIEMFVEDL